MEMPEVQPVVELMNYTLGSSLKGVPPKENCNTQTSTSFKDFAFL
jgi:hypothetical protein